MWDCDEVCDRMIRSLAIGIDVLCEIDALPSENERS